jgi:hypothetical protein
MQPRPNWANISGTVIGQSPSVVAGMTELAVKVEKSHDVTGFSNALSSRVGTVISVRVPDEHATAASSQFSGHVRLAAPDVYYADPATVNRL